MPFSEASPTQALIPLNEYTEKMGRSVPSIRGSSYPNAANYGPLVWSAALVPKLKRAGSGGEDTRPELCSPPMWLCLSLFRHLQ